MNAELESGLIGLLELMRGFKGRKKEGRSAEDLMCDMRACVKYQVFDLEATRREMEQLKKENDELKREVEMLRRKLKFRFE